MKILRVAGLIVALSLCGATHLVALDPGALDRAVAAFEAAGARSAVVLLDASTARVLYLYNPGDAVNRRYPPGSLAKPWTALALMERGDGFDPGGLVDCHGAYRPPASIPLSPDDQARFNLVPGPGGPSLRCSLAKGHGPVNLHGAIEHSCNVYFLTRASSQPAAIAEEIGSRWHLDENTGAIDLPVRELPVPRSSRTAPSPFSALAAAIGEGGRFRVSPLKAAQCYAALFQGTPLLRPHTAPLAAPVQQYPLPVNENNRRRVLAALAAVVQEGTLKGLVSPGKQILAGKTGTATMNRKKYATHGWAVVLFSQGGRTMVLTVFVSRGSGSREARSLARRVLDAL